MEDLIEKYGGKRLKVSIEELLPHPKAQAIYGYRDIEALSEEFRYRGMIQTPVFNKKMWCISGHRRILAAKMLGWTELFVFVLDTLPEEDEEFCIVSSNQMRVKTAREKYHEMRVFERELPKRQGQRLKEGEAPYDQRKAIAAAMGGKKEVSEAEVRDLMVFDGKTEMLLDTIDNKNVFLTSLADKIRKKKKNGADKYTAVVEVSLALKACPICSTHPTPRIEIIGNTLQYINTL